MTNFVTNINIIDNKGIVEEPTIFNFEFASFTSLVALGFEVVFYIKDNQNVITAAREITKPIIPSSTDPKKGIATLIFPEELAGAALTINYVFKSPIMIFPSNITSNINIELKTGSPKIERVYWSEHEHPLKDAKLTVQRELCRNEFGFLHIYTKGMFGASVFIKYEGKEPTPPPVPPATTSTNPPSYELGTSTEQIKDNMVSIPYRMSDALSAYIAEYENANTPTLFTGDKIEVFASVSQSASTPKEEETEALTILCGKDAANPQQETTGTDVKVLITTDEEAVPTHTKAQCILEFRPDGTYIGDYGFDWIRMGDTATATSNYHHDHDFENHMGKHYYDGYEAPHIDHQNQQIILVENTIEYNGNNHGNQFQKDLDSPQPRFYPNFVPVTPPNNRVYVVPPAPTNTNTDTGWGSTTATPPPAAPPTTTTTTTGPSISGSTTTSTSNTSTTETTVDNSGSVPITVTITSSTEVSIVTTSATTTITTTETLTQHAIATISGGNQERTITDTNISTTTIYPISTTPQPSGSIIYRQFESKEIDQTFGGGKMYDRLKNRFRRLIFDWDPKDATKNESETYTPIMTILNTRVADLVLHFDIKEEPKEILFEFDNPTATSFLTLDKNIINTNLGVTAVAATDKTNHTLKITCSGEFAQEYMLFARAFKKDAADGTVDTKGEICAMLRILPNAPQYHFKPKVVFVSCETLLSGSTPQVGIVPPTGRKKLTDILGQALVFPEIGTTESLDLTDPAVDFNRLCCQLVPGTGTPAVPAVYDKIDEAKGEAMRTLLLDKLRADYAGKYEHYYKIFFFQEEENSPTAGYSWGEKYIVCYKSINTDDNLAAHELLHGLELAHPFDGVSRNTQFTYKYATTDNIMDYSDIEPPKPVVKCLYHWQWQIVNPKIR